MIFAVTLWLYLPGAHWQPRLLPMRDGAECKTTMQRIHKHQPHAVGICHTDGWSATPVRS